jgi:P4 family phage/plasmid primase-like protien
MSKINELIMFLSRHKTKKDEKPTHTGMYAPLIGSWNLNTPDLETQFWSIYTDLYIEFNKRESRLGLGITETQTDSSPLLIDIDIKTATKNGRDRIYTHHDVMTLVEAYRTVTKKYVHVENDDAHLFEKPDPRSKSDHVKDGFHVMFLNIVVSKQVHRQIHREVKDIFVRSNELRHLCGLQTVEALIDDAVISNNWMIYGSIKKDDTHPYVCTFVLQGDQIHRTTHVDDPRLFSIREKRPLNRETLLCESIRNVNEPEVQSGSRVEQLLSMLRPDRCDDEPSWIRVGMCLHSANIDVHLDYWREWSRQSTKYKEGDCEKEWRRFSDTKGFSIHSLSYWARLDNPDAYMTMVRAESLKTMTFQVNCGAHYDVAMMLHLRYADVYRCINPKRTNDWYFFVNHRWHEMPAAYVLMNQMSNELGKEFSEHANQFKRLMLNPDPTVVKENQLKYDKCMRLAYQVKDSNFKSGVLKECSRMFYDPDFENNLDSNVNLIGFDNGVYDIEGMCFRDGTPDDYVSKTTYMNYEEFHDKHPIVQEIYDFFEKVHPDPITREYVLTIFATFLGGSCEEQTFQIWTGAGSNGKSTVVDLFEETFGDDYTGKFSTTLLTRDRANSNACTPELQDVMKKRFASMQEPNDNDVIYTGAMKEYTGGDKIYSRGLFSKPTPFKPQFKLVMLCNKMPTIKGWDYGTWRRIRVVKYLSSFVDNPSHDPVEQEFTKDRKLTTKFKYWRQAFMWILIERLKQYNLHGLVEPDSVLNASKEYKKKSDAYCSFLDENFVLSNSSERISAQEMYESFKVWWRSVLNSTPPSKQDLMDYLQSNTKIKRTNNSHFTGIAYKNIEAMEI